MLGKEANYIIKPSGVIHGSFTFKEEVSLCQSMQQKSYKRIGRKTW
jgi:hypothetical protein